MPQKCFKFNGRWAKKLTEHQEVMVKIQKFISLTLKSVMLLLWRITVLQGYVTRSNKSVVSAFLT